MLLISHSFPQSQYNILTGVRDQREKRCLRLHNIAKMNFYTYNLHTQNGENIQLRKPYLDNYLLYEKLASDIEDKEINLEDYKWEE